MKSIITYLDAGVLIAASRGKPKPGDKAIAVLNDPRRVYIASAFLSLEVIPQAVYNQRTEEVRFYEAFFGLVNRWAKITDSLAQSAADIGSRYGLGAMDSLHIAAAMSLGAQEFVTTERSEKPIYRVSEIKVMSLQAMSV